MAKLTNNEKIILEYLKDGIIKQDREGRYFYSVPAYVRRTGRLYVRNATILKLSNLD